MKYICLGYIAESLWTTMPNDIREGFMDQCFAYDEELQRKGHFVGGEALQGPDTATTLRMGDGRISVTDGPFAETKEYLGGIMILEASDLNHAIQLMSKHPSVAMGGTWEIRPAADLAGMVAASVERRKGAAV